MRLLTKYFLIIIFIIIINVESFCQNFNRNYTSSWANTEWQFVFKKDGSYVRISDGFYGKTIVKGKYRVKKDTLYILTGIENTHGTINTKYLLHTDSLMIDLKNYYFFQRLPSYKGSKRAVVCMIGIELWVPDSIYIKHPYLLPRLDDNSYTQRYYDSFERYELRDSITATIVDYIPGVGPEYDGIVSNNLHWGISRTGEPAIFILTDNSGDFFIVVDCNWEYDFELRDKVKVLPDKCSYSERKIRFSSNFNPKFMFFGNVRKQ